MRRPVFAANRRCRRSGALIGTNTKRLSLLSLMAAAARVAACLRCLQQQVFIRRLGFVLSSSSSFVWGRPLAAYRVIALPCKTRQSRVYVRTLRPPPGYLLCFSTVAGL